MKYGICVSMYRKDSKYRKPGENVVKIREIRVSRRLENKSKYGSGKDEGGGGEVLSYKSLPLLLMLNVVPINFSLFPSYIIFSSRVKLRNIIFKALLLSSIFLAFLSFFSYFSLFLYIFNALFCMF